MIPAVDQVQRSASWRERAARGDAIIARYLAGSSYAGCSIHDTVDALETCFGELGMRRALVALGVSQDKPLEGRMYGQYRIRPPHRPDLVGTWDRHQVLQALLVGYLEAQSALVRRNVVDEVYQYLGVPTPEAEPNQGAPVSKPTLSTQVLVRWSTAIVLALDLAAWVYGIGLATHLALELEPKNVPVVQTDDGTKTPTERQAAMPRALRAEPLSRVAPEPAPQEQTGPEIAQPLLPCKAHEARARGVCSMGADETISSVARIHHGREGAWQYALRLARENSVRVPEWGVRQGAADSRRMRPGFLLRFPAD